MKVSLLATTLLLIIPGGAMAQSNPPPKTAKEFVTKAAIGGLFEIRTSQLALERSRNPDIVNFARRMISDHGDANNALKMTARASPSSEALPASLDPPHEKIYSDLQKLDGVDFDAAYITAQSNAHFEAVALFDAYAKGGNDGKLKAFAAETLPTLRAHQDALAHLGAR
jgi:putative membrane protein